MTKPAKPPRKRNIHGAVANPANTSKEGKQMLREQKKKLSKKYERLITALMDRCEKNVVAVSCLSCKIVALTSHNFIKILIL